MKTIWFKKAGLIYLPVSLFGGLFYLLTIVFCVNVFIAIDRHAYSVSDTLYGVFPYFVSAFTLLFWIAANTSGKGESGIL